MLAQQIRLTLTERFTALGLDVQPQSLEVTLTFVVLSLLVAALGYWFAHRIVLSLSKRVEVQNIQTVAYHVNQQKLPHHLSILLPLFALDLLIPIALSHYHWLSSIMERLLGVILLFAFINLLFSILNIANDVAKSRGMSKKMPIKSFVQLTKLFIIFIGIVVSVSILANQSPLIFLSSLGVATGFVMLIFKDTILGFVAGIQLSANDMVSLNDWIELDSYGANGCVEEITLTTVKVRNFDNTIAMLPTYALVQNAFVNWQGMSDSGGRRIKRAINIDLTSIKFFSQEELDNLANINLLRTYMEKKRREIEEYNDKFEQSQRAGNTRNITNIGLFRAYIKFYLFEHKGINQSMFLMSRQLDPGEHGLPIEVYAFTNSTDWEIYENIQSDIFDHLYSILPLFDLRPYQSPTSHDVLRLSALR